MSCVLPQFGGPQIQHTMHLAIEGVYRITGLDAIDLTSAGRHHKQRAVLAWLLVRRLGWANFQAIQIFKLDHETLMQDLNSYDTAKDGTREFELRKAVADALDQSRREDNEGTR